MPVPLSILDLAQHAEQWGYKRYWIAEHHFVAVAGSSPAVLIGQIAAATERIHVGAAAVQLGHTTAAAVVESFGILDAFHPGRIDLGVGRSGQKRRETADQPPEPAPEPTVDWRDVDDVIVAPPFDPGQCSPTDSAPNIPGTPCAINSAYRLSRSCRT